MLNSCWAQGDFAAQVSEVRVRDRVGEEFFDDRQEVMQGADGSQGHSVGPAGRAASGGEQKGGFDKAQDRWA